MPLVYGWDNVMIFMTISFENFVDKDEKGCSLWCLPDADIIADVL